MSLSTVESYSHELRKIVSDVVGECSENKEVQEIVTQLAVYTISHALDVRTHLFEGSYSGSPVEKLKGLLNTTIDHLCRVLDHRDFMGLSVEKLEPSIKMKVYDYVKEKLHEGHLTKENYQEFIYYLQESYDKDIVLDLVRVRVLDDREKREEFKALLEYATFLGRNYFEIDEIERLEDAINFRLNLLKNYGRDYFCRNFLLLKNHVKIIPDEFSTHTYYIPTELLKEMKNLILHIERGQSHSVQVQHEARNVIRKQLEIIRRNQERLQNLQRRPDTNENPAMQPQQQPEVQPQQPQEPVQGQNAPPTQE